MTDRLALRQALEAIAGCSNDRDVWDRYGWVYATDGDERDARFWCGMFRASGITLEMRGYRAFPWLEAPALG